jgi:hypothetical protein
MAIEVLTGRSVRMQAAAGAPATSQEDPTRSSILPSSKRDLISSLATATGYEAVLAIKEAGLSLPNVRPKGVTRKLWGLLGQGVMPDPSQRPANFSLVAEALRPERTRIWGGAVAMTASALALASFALVRSRPATPVDPCAAQLVPMDAVWSPVLASQVREAMSNAKASAESISLVQRSMASFREQWTQRARSACLEGRQDPCLDRQLESAKVRVRLLLRGNAALYEKSSTLLSRLGSDAVCSEGVGEGPLRGQPPEGKGDDPAGASGRTESGQTQSRGIAALTEAQALYDLGLHDQCEVVLVAGLMEGDVLPAVRGEMALLLAAVANLKGDLASAMRNSHNATQLAMQSNANGLLIRSLAKSAFYSGAISSRNGPEDAATGALPSEAWADLALAKMHDAELTLVDKLTALRALLDWALPALEWCRGDKAVALAFDAVRKQPGGLLASVSASERRW